MEQSGLAEPEPELTGRLTWACIREVGKAVFGKKVWHSSCPVLSTYSAVINIRAAQLGSLLW